MRASARPARRRSRVFRRGAAGAALCVGLVAQAAEAQPAGGADPEVSTAGGSGGAGAFVPPSPPLSGGSSAGRDLGAIVAPPAGAPAGGLGAFGIPGGIAGETGPTGPTREFTFTPRIDVSEAYESNIAGSTGGFGSAIGVGALKHQDDFITYFTPSIAVTADTPRLQGSLFYAPTAQLYAFNSGQNSIGQNLNASATLTVLPGAIYVNASAVAAIQPRFGGVSSGTFGGFGSGAANLSRSQQSQFYSYSVEPYVVQRFGDVGTAKIGYTFQQSYNDNNGTYYGGQGALNPALNGGGPFQAQQQQNLLADTGNANVTTNREDAEFTSGDILGRFRSITLLSASQFGGGGVDSGAYENFFSEELGYAVTHQLTVFGEGGYEDIRYSTFPVTKINDPIWSFGAKVAPNPDSTVTLGYGHKYGFNSVFANGSYAVTARTRLTGVYQTGLGTALQGLQSTIGNGALDAFGNPVDYSTGAPTYLASGEVGTTGNGALYRISQFTFTAATTYERDTYSLAFSGTNENLVGAAIGAQTLNGLPVATSQRSYSVIASWRHDLTEELSSALSFSYGRSRQGGQGGAQDTYGADLVINQALSDTLSAYLRYSFYDDGAAGAGSRAGAYTDNIIRIGLSKTF